ncbi:hypothetical protein CVT24_000574 [Panaeolus cyanescens]|uniref:Uncharacterized protein n=1 Tax=Panaeolus cyanescens TaxID=181874 RepID=A0A409YDB6_9AGAR|nr:hypothetical protein CVT24_000574 [Panaeolus cyanescens]
MAAKSGANKRKKAPAKSEIEDIEDVDNVSESAQDSSPKKCLRNSKTAEKSLTRDVAVNAESLDKSAGSLEMVEQMAEGGDRPSDRSALSHLLGSEELNSDLFASESHKTPSPFQDRLMQPSFAVTPLSGSQNIQAQAAPALASPFAPTIEPRGASSFSNLTSSNTQLHGGLAFPQDPFAFYAQWQLYENMLRAAHMSVLSSSNNGETRQTGPALTSLGGAMGNFPYNSLLPSYPFLPNPSLYPSTVPTEQSVRHQMEQGSSSSAANSAFAFASQPTPATPAPFQLPAFFPSSSSVAAPAPSIGAKIDIQSRGAGGNFSSNQKSDDVGKRSKGKEKESVDGPSSDSKFSIQQENTGLSEGLKKSALVKGKDNVTKQSQLAHLRSEPHSEMRTRFMQIVPTRETKVPTHPFFMTLPRILKQPNLSEKQIKSIEACDAMVAVGPYANLSRVKSSNITYSVPQYRLVWSDGDQQPVVGVMLGGVVKSSIISPHLHSANPPYNYTSQHQRRISIVPTLTSWKSFRGFLADVFPKLQSVKLQLESGTDIVFTSHRENTKWRGDTGESKAGVALFERGDSEDEEDGDADDAALAEDQRWFFERYGSFREYEDGIPIYDCREFGFLFDEEGFADLKVLPEIGEDVPAGSIVAVGYTPNLFKANHFQSSPSKASASKSAATSNNATSSADGGDAEDDHDLNPSSSYCLSLNAHFIIVLSTPKVPSIPK